MLLGDAAGKVHKRRVHERRHDENTIAEHENFADGIPRENARKRKQVEHDYVNELAHQRRTVVAQPQESFAIAELLFGPFPDGVVSPNVIRFADGIGKQAREHHARRIREHRTDRFGHCIACSRDVQKPALRNENKRHIREDADFHATARLLFAIDFAHHIRCEEGGCENDVTERRVESKRVHENQDFDVRGNRCNNSPGENALFAKEAEESDETSKEHENGGYHKEFVL